MAGSPRAPPARGQGAMAVRAVSLLVLLGLLPFVKSIYEDDGHFHPAMVKPEHFMTEGELLEDEFYDRLLEAQEEERAARRRAQTAGEEEEYNRALQTDDPTDNYNQDPLEDQDIADACSLGGPVYCCTNCPPETMIKCRMLGGRLLEDKYGRLKAGETKDDSCKNLEERAGRLDVFGRTKTFRDTTECRTMVYDYTCLWWGSHNSVYSNNCEDYKAEQIDGSEVRAAYQPCLSFCTQVANMCANRPDWIKLCSIYGIQCEASPDAQQCEGGPTEGQSGVGCDYYNLVSFYSAAEGIFISRKSMWALALSGALALVLS